MSNYIGCPHCKSGVILSRLVGHLEQGNYEIVKNGILVVQDYLDTIGCKRVSNGVKLWRFPRRKWRELRLPGPVWIPVAKK